MPKNKKRKIILKKICFLFLLIINYNGSRLNPGQKQEMKIEFAKLILEF